MSPIFALLLLLLFFLCLSLALVWLSLKLPKNQKGLTEKILQKLPQTQCAQCGFAGCAPYAEAIVKGESISKCVPGGKSLALELEELLSRQEDFSKTTQESNQKELYFVEESLCIGCTKCIQACPVDCIIGARSMMHTIYLDECTGCALCLDPCPTGAIKLVPPPFSKSPLIAKG